MEICGLGGSAKGYISDVITSYQSVQMFRISPSGLVFLMAMCAMSGTIVGDALAETE